MSTPGNPPVNPHEIHALSGAYAVDALDPAEREQFEQHLASCAECRAEVASLREATTLLGGLDETEPPVSVRAGVLAGIATIRPLPPEVAEPAESAESTASTDRSTAAVTPLPARRRRWTALAAAAAVLAVVGGGAVVWQQVDRPDRSQQALSETDRVLQAADARRVNLSLPGGVRASLVRSVTEGRAVLVTRNMPAAPAGKVYELWLQTPGGAMVPAGLMKEAGSRTVLLRGDATTATGAGITVEPEGGSESPTTEPIALFDFSRAT
jgi:anti-sigma-K factor RskA